MERHDRSQARRCRALRRRKRRDGGERIHDFVRENAHQVRLRSDFERCAESLLQILLHVHPARGLRQRRFAPAADEDSAERTGQRNAAKNSARPIVAAIAFARASGGSYFRTS